MEPILYEYQINYEKYECLQPDIESYFYFNVSKYQIWSSKRWIQNCGQKVNFSHTFWVWKINALEHTISPTTLKLSCKFQNGGFESQLISVTSWGRVQMIPRKIYSRKLKVHNVSLNMSQEISWQDSLCTIGISGIFFWSTK